MDLRFLIFTGCFLYLIGWSCLVVLETVHYLSSKQSPGHGLPSLVYGGRHLLLALSQSMNNLLMAGVQGGNQLPHFIDDPLVVLLGMLAVLSSTPALIGWQ